MDSENKDEITEPETPQDAPVEEVAAAPGECSESPAPDSGVASAPVESGTQPAQPAAPEGDPESVAQPDVENADAAQDEASASRDPGASHAVSVGPDESEPVSVIGADGEETIVSEPCPPSESVVGVPDPSPYRQAVLSALFQEERPRPGQVMEAAGPYLELVSTAVSAGLPLEEEVAALAACVAGANGAAVEEEQARESAVIERSKAHINRYESVFEHLGRLLEKVSGELEGMDEADSAFQAAPEETQAALLNHKKGVEIIQRMIDRLIQRKKALEEPPARIVTRLPQLGRPASPTELGEHVSELVTAFHDVRDGNYHVIQTVEGECKKCHEQTLQNIKGMLSVVDGIDSGLEYEVDSQKSVPLGDERGEDLAGLVPAWFGVYARLTKHLETFLEAVGMEAQTAERGTAFDPEVMEPTGTISDPNLPDESVARVSRRGFTMDGEIIRPISVDVVRNEQ